MCLMFFARLPSVPNPLNFTCNRKEQWVKMDDNRDSRANNLMKLKEK